MPDMQKIQVLVLDKHIDAVLNGLIELDNIQLIDVQDKFDSSEDIFERYNIPNELTEKLARATEQTIYFEGYVPQKDLKIVIKKIRNITDEACIINVVPPGPDENVPFLKKSTPNFLLSFEKLTFAVGYPSYNEVNPILIMAITFPILFGIMFADVGQGIIFIIFGLLTTYFRRKVKLNEMGDIFRYILTAGELFILLGISAIFWGFLFGEFFGPSGVIHPISIGNLGPIYFGGFEPANEPMKMLRFSIFVGVVNMSLGIILRIYNEIKKNHYKHIPISVSWLVLILGGFFMWIYWGGLSNILKWFSEGILMFIGLVILPIALITIFTVISEGVVEGVGFGIEVFAETLSHTLSYGRLLALGLVHSVMMNLFLTFGGVEHGVFPLTSIPAVAIGTIMVMIIEGLIVFVHTVRLHWIELFSKFYKGDGIPFKSISHINQK